MGTRWPPSWHFPGLDQTQRWFYSSFQYQFWVPNCSQVTITGQAKLTNFDIAIRRVQAMVLSRLEIA